MDTSREILSSALFAVQQMEVPKPPPEKLQPFLTKPLLRCFEENFDLSREKANQAFRHFWNYAGTFGVRQNQWFDGIPELLQALLDKDKTLHIATAREIAQVKYFLDFKKHSKTFSVIVGPSSDMVEQRRTKKIILFDTICEIIQRGLGSCLHEDCIMIGDRVGDIWAARHNMISSVGVTYGQDDEETLKEAEPDYIVNNTRELSEVLLQEN